MKKICIRGARSHNLKNINLNLPRNKLVVITGVSGSGKSSLAFNTLYAEGQRRYVETLSSYARQFLKLMEKPDVDAITGLSPAISIEQKTTGQNPRSTVGTITEIYDYLRLLYSRIGTPYCPNHPKNSLMAQSVSQIVDTVLTMSKEIQLMILAPIITNAKGEYSNLIKEMQAQGFSHFRIQNGIAIPKIYDINNLPKFKKTEKHNIDIIIDNFSIKIDIKQRLTESFETALRLSNGRAIVLETNTGKEHVYSNKFACSICSYSLRELEPRLFSFNNPIGACSKCSGLGYIKFFDPKRIISPNQSLVNGAIKYRDYHNKFYSQILLNLAKFYTFNINTSFRKLSEKIQKIILYGSGYQVIPFHDINEHGHTIIHEHPFEGVINNLQRCYNDTNSILIKKELAQFISKKECTSCHGTRLCLEARHIKIDIQHKEYTIHEITTLSLHETLILFKNLQLTNIKQKISNRIINEIKSRLQFLNDVGLYYLSLARNSDTLSGGEAQRIRLASQIGSGLTGVMYILDEPSIGLHQRDNEQLIHTLKNLRDIGNSVFVVEHDEDAIRNADYIVDMGLGAGTHGGNVIAQGTLNTILKNTKSFTAKYLQGLLKINIPKKRTPINQEKILTIVGAKSNNLKNITLNLPVGLLTCITGVSGSGKSTLINNTLYLAISRYLYNSQTEPAIYESITGIEHFNKVILIDQTPIGRTPRSNPATYVGLFTQIRDLFTNVPLAKQRGYNAGRFSFNLRGGRCETCKGDGIIKVEMHFLPDIYVSCDICDSKRYNRETLEIKYKNKNIAEILDMTVEDACIFFKSIPAINHKLNILINVGLGYIKLGQSATTFSGGEAQRIRLSLELSKRSTGRTLYILDEPTIGLHFHDINLLLKIIQQLRDQGNTIIIIEHNLEVIKTADWIIDLGPGGGNSGGKIIGMGTPEDITKNLASITGQYLKKVLIKDNKNHYYPTINKFNK